MPTFENHCAHSMECFGEDGAEYHKWIDQYAKHGYHHRKVLHHKEGIEVGVQLFGEVARKHLSLHVRDDLQVEKIPKVDDLRQFGRAEPGLKSRASKYVIHYEDGLKGDDEFR